MGAGRGGGLGCVKKGRIKPPRKKKKKKKWFERLSWHLKWQFESTQMQQQTQKSSPVTVGPQQGQGVG